MKKALAISSLLIGIVFLAGCGQQQLATNQPAVIQPVDETASWQTYKNDEYGFEIKFPKDYKLDWAVDYTDITSLKQNNIDIKDVVDVNKAQEKETLLSVSFQPYGINITKTKFDTVDKWFNSWKKEIEKPSNYEGIMIEPNVASSENINISGIIGKKICLSGMPYGDTLVAMIKNGYLYEVSYNGTILGGGEVNDNILNKHREIFNKIVSTFKFTN